MQKIATPSKCTGTDLAQIAWECDLAQARLPQKCLSADAGDRLSFNRVGDLDIRASSRVGTDLDGAVVQLHVRVRNSVLLVHPMRIQRQICRKLIGIPIVFLCEIRIVIPAVKDRVQTLRLGNILQSMVAYENLFCILQLISHHIEGDLTAALQNQGTCVNGTVPIVPITAKITKIIARGVQGLLHLIKRRVAVS